jgi:hypothetical protein
VDSEISRVEKSLQTISHATDHVREGERDEAVPTTTEQKVEKSKRPHMATVYQSGMATPGPGRLNDTRRPRLVLVALAKHASDDFVR